MFNIYENLFFPLKKIIFGDSAEQFNRDYWERLAANEADPNNRCNLRLYSDAMVAADFEIVQAYLPSSGMVIADIGCAYGDALASYRRRLAHHHRQGFGFDVSQSAVQKAAHNWPDAKFYCLDFSDPSITVPQETLAKINLVFSHSVLQCIPEKHLGTFLGNVNALLQDGGLVLLFWWAPYYLDETWMVRFGPGSHRHRTKTVRKIAARYFERLPEVEEALDKIRKGQIQKGSKNKAAWWRRLLHLVLMPCHPKDVGIFVGKKIAMRQ